MQDTPPERDRDPERDEMVSSQLARRGIRAPRVLEAMGRIPREHFVPPNLRASAYADSALPIDCGQTISQPYIVARMTELLDLHPHDDVLEIGTGSGYQTAILACLARHVFTIEWHASLMTRAAARLEQLGLRNVTCRCGDGSTGWPGRGPFPAILVTAGAPDVPTPLCDQLVLGGRLVAPVGPTSDQVLVLVRRTHHGLDRQDILKCRFVKLLGSAGWKT